ncbi:MAG: hypothetical protein ACRCUJ_04605 [Phocaeicola sp.]
MQFVVLFSSFLLMILFFFFSSNDSFLLLMILLAVHFFCLDTRSQWVFISFFLIKKKRNQRKNQGCLVGATPASVFCVRKGTCTSCFGQPFLCYAKTGASVLRPHQEAGPRDATLLGLCPRSFLFVVCCNFAWLRLCWLLGFNFTRFARSLLGLASPSLFNFTRFTRFARSLLGLASPSLFNFTRFARSLLGLASLSLLQLYSLCSFVVGLGFAFVASTLLALLVRWLCSLCFAFAWLRLRALPLFTCFLFSLFRATWLFNYRQWWVVGVLYL